MKQNCHTSPLLYIEIILMENLAQKDQIAQGICMISMLAPML